MAVMLAEHTQSIGKRLEALQIKWFGQSFVAALPATAPTW
jgi:hypothetical protein